MGGRPAFAPTAPLYAIGIGRNCHRLTIMTTVRSSFCRSEMVLAGSS